MASVVDELQLAFHPEFRAYRNASCAATCLLQIKAPDVNDEARAPVSLTTVLDVSGSMAGQKLDLVKSTVLFLLKQLNERDSIGVVTFDSNVRTASFSYS